MSRIAISSRGSVSCSYGCSSSCLANFSAPFILLLPAQVSLSDIEKALNTSDVDEVIITAVHHGVLMGRIDECGGVLNVQAVLRRQFSMAEWKELDGQLDRWIGKLDQLKVIYNRA